MWPQAAGATLTAVHLAHYTGGMMRTRLDFDFFQTAYSLSRQEIEAFLRAFERPSQAARDLLRLAEDAIFRENHPELLAALVQGVPRLPDPDEALNLLERIYDSATERQQLLALLSGEPRALNILLAMAAQSPFLCEIAARRPEHLVWLLSAAELERLKRWPHYRQEIEAALKDCLDGEEAAQRLRRYQHREILRIAVRDILGLGSIKDWALELSNLADNIVHEVCRQVREQYRQRYGPARTEGDREAQFAVIALGKLGGRELNFSSDIDLMFVYEGEGRPTKGNLDNFEYFARLAADIVGTLSTATDEGYLYRVDTRLRPEGSRGALVRSLPSVELYYESWGENWERQALLKARPVGGDPELGRKFLRTIKPFTFRKYVDPVSVQETLRAMHELRSKSIQDARTTPAERERNFKTGPGGIRDVEFIVQAIQMLYGGQYPEIRCAGTLESLHRIRESGLLTEDDFAALLHGYRFLRRLEHRLQMEEQLQVYTLPASAHQQDVLAKRLGYESRAQLLDDYRRHTEGIHALFDGIFAPFATADLFESLLDESQDQEVWHSHHVHDAKRARSILKDLAADPKTPHLTPKVRRLFRQILPRLMDCIEKAPASELALSSFERIVSAVGARSSFYAVLSANPQFLELLVSLGSHSKYLTDTLVRFPALLDRLADPSFLHQPLEARSLESDHQFLKEALTDTDPVDVLRRLRRIETLKVGLRYLLRLSDVSAMTQELSTLAGYILERVLEIQLDRYEQKYGSPRLSSGEPCRVAIIGMGKLGGEEINFSSDLDLLFVYEEDNGKVIGADANTETIGVKEYFVRLAGDILKSLSSRTEEGGLYQADVRLRPYGKGGDLAGTLQQYRDYYQREAALWERQALTKACLVAGDGELGRRFLEQAAEFVYGQGLSSEQKGEIAHLRGRIERERKGQGLKSGEGGLIDVEFLVQALQLEHGRDHPSVRPSNTAEALAALSGEGLLGREDADNLLAHYLFLRDIENRLQIMDGISTDELPTDQKALEQLVRRLYHLSEERTPTSQAFIEKYNRCREEIRAIYGKHFA